MIDLTGINQVYLFSGKTDFRKGIMGLAGKVLSSFPDAQSRIDNLYLFCSSSKNQIKILHFDINGIWLYQKRLNNSKFIYPDIDGSFNITKDNLITILEGLSFIDKIEGKIDVKYSLF